jgi:hypothetical protein
MVWWKKVKNWALEGMEEKAPLQFNPTEYHPKINLAWSACLRGDENIIRWLNENGYNEIVQASAALHGNQNAREWLVVNNYPQLMAFISAIEGDEKALKWLEEYHFDLFFYLSLAILKDKRGLDWIGENCSEDIAVLGQSLFEVQRKFRSF